MVGGLADGTVDHFDAPLGTRGADPPRDGRIDRAHVNQHRSPLHRMAGTVWPEAGLLDIRPVGQHRDDGLRPVRRFAGGSGGPTPRLPMALKGSRIRIETPDAISFAQ